MGGGSRVEQRLSVSRCDAHISQAKTGNGDAGGDIDVAAGVEGC